MRRAALLFLFLAFACGPSDDPSSRPVSEPGEKLHPITGVILAQDVADNSIQLKHEAIPGFMEAMTMDFKVRGAKVTALPAVGTKIEGQLHVTDNSYWLTDVRQVQ